MNIRRKEEIEQQIQSSKYLSRDISWLEFNYRVLAEAKNTNRSLIDRMRFIAIASSNLDEFFSIRVGSLYNYIDFEKERTDYSGLELDDFKVKLLESVQAFSKEMERIFIEELSPLFAEHGLNIGSWKDLSLDEKKKVNYHFKKRIFPTLTPMTWDSHRPFPIILSNLLVFFVLTKETLLKKKADRKKVSFVQIPKNLDRFYEIERENETLFLPIEEIVKHNLHHLFKEVEITTVELFRVTRNADFNIDESEDMETEFIKEMRKKLQERRTGRVVRLESRGKNTQNDKRACV